ncbi:MAG: diadenylate cyclase CdaA [Candidatus Marinimicrobia bacterium]|nr:diadenylate cyclase CdaA [Candidatus Neomarinimicrobiota bacterium]MCF7839607.1 diadenylate cyclase CdaA [Candidatus Neomarinimicrobiota bacterium]
MELLKFAFISIRVYDLVDILAVSFVLYKLYQIFKGSRAAQMLIGMVILIFLSIIVRFTELSGMTWLLSNLSTVWVIAFVILFQPELRRILIYVGQNPLIRFLFRVRGVQTVDEIVSGILMIQKRGWGALIVIQGDVGLRHIKEKGVDINAEVTAELLVSLFNPTSPLHDGAVIVHNEMIDTAKCILPLSEEPAGSRMKLGTRHLAALGLSEESDALVLVVSEETHAISYAYKGVMKRGLDEIQLKKAIQNLIYAQS